MSNDSIASGASADAYGLDDTEPSVATSDQSDRDAALAANDYPNSSESAPAEEASGPLGAHDPAHDYVESAEYGGGLADIGLAEREIEQVLDDSDYDPVPAPPHSEELSATGNPGVGTRGNAGNAQFPEGSGNPGPNLDGEEPHGTTQYPSGAGNPGPGNDEVGDPERSGSGNPGPSPDGLEQPGVALGEFAAAAPFVPGLAATMPPIPPGGLPLPPEPGPDIPQPQIPDGDRPARPTPHPGPPGRPVPGGGAAEPAIPLPGTPGFGLRPSLLRDASAELSRETLLLVAGAVAALLAVQFISIAAVLGLSRLIGLSWALFSVGTIWLVGAGALGLASGNRRIQQSVLPAAESMGLSGLRGRLA